MSPYHFLIKPLDALILFLIKPVNSAVVLGAYPRRRSSIEKCDFLLQCAASYPLQALTWALVFNGVSCAFAFTVIMLIAA